mmetsp:Transcript_3124/g.19264  ORF Transcript_3124/g.19264 Transcript_3124/m.19264 type:complete len:209 (-) Transcript_3124:2410-3036(-)
MPTHTRLSVRVLNTRREAFGMAHEIASSFMLTYSTHLTDFCQLASALEIAHAAFGLVPSSPITSLMQWTGRSHVLFVIVYCIEELQNSVATTVLFVAWALTEIIRYPQYALTSLGVCPSWLTWARYTVFIPLYPIGVVAEIVLMYKGLGFVKRRNLHNLRMPNTFNFAFDYHNFVVGLLLLYPFLWWSLYSYMLRQRKKKVGRKKKQT